MIRRREQIQNKFLSRHKMPGLNSYRQDRFSRIRTRETSLFQAPRESVRSAFLFPLSRPANFSRAFHFRDFPTIWEPGTG